jgi:hypothetical protein
MTHRTRFAALILCLTTTAVAQPPVEFTVNSSPVGLGDEANPNKVNPGDKVVITNRTGEPLTVSPKVPDSTPVVIAELFGPSILIPGGADTPTKGTFPILTSSALIGFQFELDPSTASNELPGL